LGQLVFCSTQVLCIGFFKQLDLHSVHGFCFGCKAQVAQQANFNSQGVNLGLAQQQFGLQF
jgi:hypothetical protein